jgi:hypothetical protein
LLTAALWSVLTWARTRWPLVTILLAATPTALYSTAVAAPNGVQLAAGITLWCALLGLARVGDERTRSRLLMLTAVAGTVTACTHSLGIIWVPLVLLVAWYATGARHPRDLLASPRTRRWALLSTLLYLSAAAWVVLARTNSPQNELTQGRTDSAVSSVVLGWVLWPLQAISAAPNRVDSSPAAVYAIWLVGVGVLVWAALRALLVKERRSLAVLVALSLAIPSILTLITYHQLGAAWQGRYGYVLGVGLLLLLAAAADRPGGRALPPVPAGLFVAMLVTAQVLAQLGARSRSLTTNGLVDATHWHPPGTMLFVLCGIVACVLLVRSLALVPVAQPADRSVTHERAVV